MTENIIKEEIKQTDMLIDIDLKGVKSFNLSKIDYCYEQGYKQALESIKKWK